MCALVKNEHADIYNENEYEESEPQAEMNCNNLVEKWRTKLIDKGMKRKS